MNFLALLYSEDNVVLPTNINHNQVVILGKFTTPFIYGTNPFFLHPQTAIIFPDADKALRFIDYWKLVGGCDDYRELMVAEDYMFYVVDIAQDKDKYYADEIRMRFDYETIY